MPNGRHARGLRARVLVANLVLIALSCSIALVIAETAIRLIEPRSDRKPLCREIPGSERMYGLLPDRTVLRNGTTIHTNSAGMRGPEYALAKPPGTVRIAGLGDSFTFGTGVPFEETWLQSLQRRLNAAGGAGGARYEVMNFGVEGYNTEQELAAFREQAAAYAPDLAVLGYVYNDVDPKGTPAEAAPMPEAKRVHQSLTRAILSLKEKSHLFSFLSPRLGAALRRLGLKEVGSVGVYSDAFRDGRRGWSRSREALLTLDSLTASRSCKLVVVVFPAFVSLHKGEYPLEQYHQAVTDFCRRHSIPVLDLYPVFEGQRASRFWVSLTDPHPNARAARIVSEALDRFLSENRLLPSPSG